MQKKNTTKRAQGFTLIEMAIVLVIIGLIIGAVLKGQDIITNARMKRFINFGRLGEISQWGYYDRNGAFAKSLGYLNSMGDWMQANSTLNIGPANWHIYLTQMTDANDKVHDGIMIVPGVTTAALTTTSDRDLKVLEYFKAFDTAIDGSTGYDDGRVVSCDYAVSSAPTSGNVTWAKGATTSLKASEWGSGTNTALVYWYDTIPD